MIEALAISLFLLWILGLVSGAGGLAVHVLLGAGVGLLLLRGYRSSHSRSLNEVSPASILAIMTRKSREEP